MENQRLNAFEKKRSATFGQAVAVMMGIVLVGSISVRSALNSSSTESPFVAERDAGSLDGSPDSAAPPPPGVFAQPEELAWHDDLETALLQGMAEYRPIFVFITTPHCGYCHRMKADVLSQPEVTELLDDFVRVEVDLSENPMFSARYQVRGVPAILFLSSDGRERGRRMGFVTKDQLVRTMRDALDLRLERDVNEEVDTVLELLRGNKEMPDGEWRKIFASDLHPETRKEVRDRVLSREPFPRKPLVELLSDSLLEVRMNIIEILEVVAGDDFGYDPWGAPSNEVVNVSSLERWSAWAANNEIVTNVYSSLTREQVDSYIRDLISTDRGRSVRAMRMLEQGGESTAVVLKEYLERHTDIAPGIRKRILEVKYAVLLPVVGEMDPSTFAHRLVYGNQDVKLSALRGLSRIGATGIPVLTDFLEAEDPVIRETAIDALIAAGGRAVVSLLGDHLATEEDLDVIISTLRGLGGVKSKRVLNLLSAYLDHEEEDVVVTVLASMTRLGSDSASDKVKAMLQDPRWRVRAAALTAVQKLDLDSLREDVEALVHDEDKFVQYNAVSALRSVGGKGSAELLEQLFLENDTLKAPALAALCDLDETIPRSFADAIEGKDSKVLLPVIQSLENCGDGSLFLALQIADHPDVDVSCAALRLLAQDHSSDATVTPYLASALESGIRAKVLTVLRSFEPQSVEMRFNFSTSALDSEELEDLVYAEDLQIPTGEDPVGDVVDAFLEAGPAAGPDRREGEPDIDELFDAFGVADGTDPMMRDSVLLQVEGSTLAGIARQIMDGHEDSDVRLAAALMLLKLDEPAALPFIALRLFSLTTKNRILVANLAGETGSAGALPVLRVLLKDSVGKVRQAAVSALIEGGRNEGWVEAVSGELVRPGTKLKPEEAFTWHLREQPTRVLSKSSLREWATGLLEQDQPDLHVMGLVLLESSWRKGDVERVIPFLDAADHWVRRAAWRLLSVKDHSEFRERIETVAGDVSEYVRAVVPASITLRNHGWINYFGEGRMSGSRYSVYVERSSRRKIADPEKTALQRLLEDSSPLVKFEAYYALFTAFEDFDIREFMQAIDSLPDQEVVGERVASFLVNNYKRLGHSFAPLLKYARYLPPDEEKVTKAYKYFGVAEESLELVVLLRDASRSSQAVYDLTTSEMEENPAEESIRVVFFHENGCESCEEVAMMLSSLQQSFPEMVIEAHEINEPGTDDLQRTLSEKFEVSPDFLRSTPAVFAGAGYLVEDRITMSRLGELVAGSLTIADDDWFPPAALPPPIAVASAAPVPESSPRSAVGIILLLAFAGVLGSLIAVGFKRA